MIEIGRLSISSSEAVPFAREKLRAALVAAGIRQVAAGHAISLLSRDLRARAPLELVVLLEENNKEISLQIDASAGLSRRLILPAPLNERDIGTVSEILAFLTRDELLHDLERQVEQRTAELKKERERSERLLRNMLPDSIAARMKDNEVIADHHVASVLFIDIVGFTAFARDKSASDVVAILDRIFKAFDGVIKRHGLEKIKTIGDGYLAVAGLPHPQFDHADRAVLAGLDIVGLIPALREEIGCVVDVRVGIHSGDVLAGVIGVNKPFYDIWGDTVNVAARLEQTGTSGKVHISQEMRDKLGARFRYIGCGLVELKNRGKLNTWFVDRL
ncbi:MAG: adenylate/guanylate cyclase domain-containing protein [Hyphomicrobiales bacterium]|jgi:class 3 adenylate cyclase|nr:MAG: adenylate/guanylate cyclase domain-containing protein [Hyphomicrobiales bacterium]